MHDFRRKLLLLSSGVLLLLAACTEDVQTMTCSVHEGDPEWEAVETRCDGIDNDCDGETDALLPLAVNACQTNGVGACAQGFAGCKEAQKVCLTPPPMPESKNGVDDNCDGMVDNLPDVTPTTARVRLTMAPEVWADVEQDPNDPKGTTKRNLEPILATTEVLHQAGVTFDAPDTASPLAHLDWNHAIEGDLAGYSVLVLAGYNDESFFKGAASAGQPDQLEMVRQWVSAGGTLVVVKAVQPWTEPGTSIEPGSRSARFLDLIGATSIARSPTPETLEVAATNPATYYLDSPEERQLAVLPRGEAPVAPEILALTPNPATGATAFATVRQGNKDVGVAWLRRPLGKGVVYTLGYDPVLDAVTTCDLNCFTPARDVAVGMFRGIVQEAAHGHAVWKHTVPGLESTVLISTHDIDAPDSHNANPRWGEAGAIQSAQIEKDLGIAGSYFVTTDYYVGYFNQALTGILCTLGSCPEAAHSVLHRDMSEMPQGACDESKAIYNPTVPTVCGEVRVSVEILNGLLPKDQQIRAWRTPYLQTPPDLYSVLEAVGIVYDSSFSVGDSLGTLPIFVPRNSGLMEAGGVGNVYSFPIVEEDGLGDTLDDGSYTRQELQASNAEKFMGRWTRTLLGNLRNNGWNVYLLHPSYGVGTNPDNLAIKLEVMRRFLKRALTFDVRVARITEAGDFWRGREGTRVEATYTQGKGYSGTIRVGKYEAPRFSLEFGDDIASFDCPDGGKVSIKGRRVVFDKPLAAGATLLFTATTP